MKKKNLIITLFLLLLLAISVTVRIYYIFCLMGEVNNSDISILINTACQIFTVMTIFFIVGSISNKDIGFGVGIVVSVLPVYIHQIADESYLNYIIFVGVVSILIIEIILRKIFIRATNNRKNTSSIDSDYQAIQDTTISKTEEQTIYEKPQMDTSLKEIKLDDLEEAGDNNIQFIENPLPVPKRREHKEMSYAVEISKENDDFDLKDLSGKDFFDIDN